MNPESKSAAECPRPAGEWAPIIDRARCEAKAACVAVCPYDVFEVRRIKDDEYRALSFIARFRVLVHGKRTAGTPNASACRACGLCIPACPEGAITLARVAR